MVGKGSYMNGRIVNRRIIKGRERKGRAGKGRWRAQREVFDLGIKERKRK